MAHQNVYDQPRAPLLRAQTANAVTFGHYGSINNDIAQKSYLNKRVDDTLSNSKAIELKSSNFPHITSNNSIDQFSSLLPDTPNGFRHINNNSGMGNAIANKAMRTGRQRKRNAARSKGGEFQAKRRKRRIYFCCVGSQIDVELLLNDQFSSSSRLSMLGKMYDEVLHLYSDLESTSKDHVTANDNENDKSNIANNKEGIRDVEVIASNDTKSALSPKRNEKYISSLPIINEITQNEYISNLSLSTSPTMEERLTYYSNSESEQINNQYHDNNDNLSDIENIISPRTQSINTINQFKSNNIDIIRRSSIDSVIDEQELENLKTGDDDFKSRMMSDIQSSSSFWNENGKEIFVFDFGAIVFWGFRPGEEQEFLTLIKEGYVMKGLLSDSEFEQGEDDMAFVTSSETSSITIANDVLSLPDRTTVKSRLAASFAIAQSAVLAIFEARVEHRIRDYKYIPERLALNGKIKLSPKELGNMIGEVYVIRHDVNLHSEILDIPDYFWKEYEVEPIYRMTVSYLEMEPRTEILNKRLDLLRELLSVLQQQHENAHNVKLEWIVIWLILISIVLELLSLAEVAIDMKSLFRRKTN
eukprot:gene13997-18773_t